MAGISSKPVKGAIFPGLVWGFTRLGLHTDASVLASSTINGPCGTWAKTGTGEYTYTLADGFKVNGAGWRLAAGTSPGGSAFLSLIGAAAGTIGVELKSLDLSGGTLVVRTFTKSTGAAADTSAALQIDVMLALFDSSVT